MKINPIYTLLLFGASLSSISNTYASVTSGSEESKTPSFNFTSTAAAQSALSGKKFCTAIDSELGGHLPPSGTTASTKTYFCKVGTVSDVTTLKDKVATLTINSCQKDAEHEGYQRCLTTFNQIDGCTGDNAGPAHNNKATGNATVIYNPVNDCIVNAFPPATVHKTTGCLPNCRGS
ncbi:hypothetical protein IM40_09405 (plasmid) [Candidatus Paracaedimonas acanthamoebae]|nr:hypothetical protein IM40_09405 [Candidatus Paracaedimonas acanthamoebae]